MADAESKIHDLNPLELPATKKAASDFIKALNESIPDNKLSLRKFAKSKTGVRRYDLQYQSVSMQMTQEKNGVLAIEGDGDPKEFALRVLEIYKPLRVKQQEALKNKVQQAIAELSEKASEDDKYEVARKIVHGTKSHYELKQQKNKIAGTQVMENDAPTITLRLEPIYKKKDNNAESKDLDWQAYEEIAKAYAEAGIKIRLEESMFARNKNGTRAYSDEAELRLKELFALEDSNKNPDNAKLFVKKYLPEEVVQTNTN